MKILYYNICITYITKYTVHRIISIQLNILYTWNVTIYTNYDYILYHMINSYWSYA